MSRSKSIRFNRYIPCNRDPDKFDRIKDFYVTGKKLNEVQEKKRLQYEEAHRLRLAGYSKNQTVKLLIKRAFVDSDDMAYRVVNGAEVLFGDIAAANKDGLRVILTENFLRIYQFAKKANDIKEMNRALENVAKINNLVSEQDPIDWDKVFIPIPVYTTNPKALKNDTPDYIEPEIITPE